jgi:hypothetical protein
VNFDVPKLQSVPKMECDNETCGRTIDKDKHRKEQMKKLRCVIFANLAHQQSS